MKALIKEDKARINIQIPLDLKARLKSISKKQGMNVTTFIRKSIEEKLSTMEKAYLETKMKEAYLELAQENLAISEEFKFVDAENLD